MRDRAVKKDDHTLFKEKFKIVLKNKLSHLYITCFYHIITCVCCFILYINLLQYYHACLINWTALVCISSGNRRCTACLFTLLGTSYRWIVILFAFCVFVFCIDYFINNNKSLIKVYYKVTRWFTWHKAKQQTDLIQLCAYFTKWMCQYSWLHQKENIILKFLPQLVA